MNIILEMFKYFIICTPEFLINYILIKIDVTKIKMHDNIP